MASVPKPWASEAGRVYAKRGAPLADRLEFHMVPDLNGGCWLWPGSTNSKGYGSITVEGKVQRVHRVSWRVYVGPIPEGFCVLHRCDTPPCFRPDHLFLGTIGENNADRRAKGRSASHVGVANGRALLTDRDVMAIRSTPKSYGYRIQLAKRYGITSKYISSIIARRTWADR